MKDNLHVLLFFLQVLVSLFLLIKLNKKRGLSVKPLLIFLLLLSGSVWSQPPPHTFNSSGPLFVPAGVTEMTVEAWGGGGAGGGASGSIVNGRAAAGGGGGAYAKGKITVVPGATLNVVVAPATPNVLNGTTTTDGLNGGNSTIQNFETLILAVGGAGGRANNTIFTPNPLGGVGGSSVDSRGSIEKLAGGNGLDGRTAAVGLLLYSGSGGKGGSTLGGIGGESIASVALVNAPGNPGAAPGGGGSGAMNSISLFGILGGPQIGGTGAAGQVIVTYTCPTYNISGVTAESVCTTVGNSKITLKGSAASLPVGVYNVSYSLTNPVQNNLSIAMTVTTAGEGDFTLSGLTAIGTRDITISKLTSGACFADITANNSASIITSATTVGGTVGGGTTVCSGTASGTLLLTGNTGSVLNWEFSVAPFSTYTSISNTTATYISEPLTETTLFRAVVQNGGCTVERSNPTTVTVTPLPVPTFSPQPAATVCISTDITYTTQAGQTNYIWTVPGVVGTDYNIISGGIMATDYTVTLQWLTAGSKTVTARYTSSNCPAVINASTTTAVIKTERGVVNGGLHICSGSSSPLLTLNGYIGTIVRWEYAEAIPYVWQPINHTANTYQPGLLTTSTSYRAVVKNGTCPEEFAIETRIDVDSKPATPTLGTIIQPTCINPTGSIVLNGLLGTNWTINQSGTFLQSYSASGSNFTIPNLAPGTYTFTIHENSSCPSPPTVSIEIKAPVTNIWNGTSWSKGSEPVNTEIIDFSGDYQTTGDLAGCLCIVRSGANVIVNSNHTLTITNSVSNNGGILTFEDDASLVQINNSINTGNINYKRTTPPIRLADYVYWSTPVNPQKLVDVSPSTLSDKYMSYSGTGWVITNKNTNMTVGKGYIIRGPQSYSNVTRAVYPATFIGVPNNGNVNSETLDAGKYYLLGNPYPSAIDADAFISDNMTVLEGTLYFWTHNTPVILSSNYKYTTDDYATYNLTGSVRTRIAAVSGPAGPGNNNDRPSGKIAAAQGFFVGVDVTGVVSFNNLMRIPAENTQFFKPGKTSKAAVLEKNRLWLNMTNTEGAFKEILVGYIEGATNNYEKRYDGLTFDGNKFLDFYSINSGNKLVIQGRNLPFTDTDTVPLGYRSSIEGTFTISIDQADGSLTNQPIFLEDKLNNSIHNLTASNYTFTTVAGTFDERFILRYTNKSLGIIDVEDSEQSVLVSVKDKIIKVTSTRENISEVSVYDVAGKLLYTRNKVNATELQISNLQSGNQVLLVKTILESGYISDIKTIF